MNAFTEKTAAASLPCVKTQMVVTLAHVALALKVMVLTAKTLMNAKILRVVTGKHIVRTPLEASFVRVTMGLKAITLIV